VRERRRLFNRLQDLRGNIRGSCAHATSAPGLERPLPHRHRDWTHPCHIFAGTGAPLPHRHRDWTHPCHIGTGTWTSWVCVAEFVRPAAQLPLHFAASLLSARCALMCCRVVARQHVQCCAT
jgi:hypothetical protein